MKDTYDLYDPHDTDAVRAYKAKLAHQETMRERNGVAVMGPFLALADAADPDSRLSKIIWMARAFCFAAPVLFAVAWGTGLIG